MRFLALFILLAIGLLLIIKTDGVERATGKIGWAERNFGGGGTNTFYKLLGVLLIFIGLLVVSGIFNTITQSFVRMIFHGTLPSEK